MLTNEFVLLPAVYCLHMYIHLSDADTDIPLYATISSSNVISISGDRAVWQTKRIDIELS